MRSYERLFSMTRANSLHTRTAGILHVLQLCSGASDTPRDARDGNEDADHIWSIEDIIELL